MPKNNYRSGTGVGAKGKLDPWENPMDPELRKKKEAKLLQRNIKQQERKEAKKLKKFSDKAHGKPNPQEYMKKKQEAFSRKETKSEKVAGEIEDDLRYVGGLKKPNYRELKNKLYK